MSDKQMSHTWRYAGTYGGYLPNRPRPMTWIERCQSIAAWRGLTSRAHGESHE
ncbi:hypothetical protein R77569_04356 [Ralstonia mannitolilytica]|uniref:Uncharacterized protein n=1 Tax=Ralstonia mannitolilytica TaxID=105219 RepID=A0ABN9KFV4_9RALS|nr:hypothetical protein R77569_04356 [Ralstonia mannitolilytica]